jgi:hypothetical protein
VTVLFIPTAVSTSNPTIYALLSLNLRHIQFTSLTLSSSSSDNNYSAVQKTSSDETRMLITGTTNSHQPLLTTKLSHFISQLYLFSLLLNDIFNDAGRSRVRFPKRSLDVSIYLILPAALWPWGRLSL